MRIRGAFPRSRGQGTQEPWELKHTSRMGASMCVSNLFFQRGIDCILRFQN